MQWTPEMLRKTTKAGETVYNCWVKVNPDSEVPICVGPYEDPEEVCRIANLIESAEGLARSKQIDGGLPWTRADEQQCFAIADYYEGEINGDA